MSTAIEIASQTSESKQKGYITNTNLTLWAIISALFPRVLGALKFPSPINFVHFLMVPLACGVVLFKSRGQTRKQAEISKSLLLGLFIFLIVTVSSALLNQAGVINAVLSYLLLMEPFILILTIVAIPMTLERFQSFRLWIFRFAVMNTIFAFVQHYVQRLYRFVGLEDNIKGLYIGQGSGHVLGGSVAITFAAYYFVNAKNKPLWFRFAIVMAAFNHIIIADAKQVLISFIGGYIILYLINVKDIKKTLFYIILGIVFLSVFWWAIFQFEFLAPYRTWIRPEIYGSDGEATLLKFAAFRLVPQHFTSPLNWLFGLGPGHTVGRLGGWMLVAYWDLLSPLDVTIHPVSAQVWAAVGASWLGDQSSMFSPLFGWAGVWGDLGIAGLVAYFYVGFVVWRNVCITDLSKYLILTVFVFGLIFSQLEEPGYTLFVASLVGVDWQEQKHKALLLRQKTQAMS